MKQAYYYFLFRMFRYYKDKLKENDKMAIYRTTIASSSCVSINLMSIYFIFVYFDILPIFTNKYWILPIMVGICICICNYFIFIKDRKFLEYHFTKNKIGTLKIIAYYVISLTIAISIGSFNREKIFAERKAKFPIEQMEKQNSLESKLRDWWNKR